LPEREYQALRAWLHTFYPFQLEWVLDWGLNAVLVKSRKIGGSYSYAAAVALWSLVGEETFIVSEDEDKAKGFLKMVEKHCRVLAGLGSHWARPRRKHYITTNPDLIAIESGGRATACASTSPVRSFGGNIVFDEFAYHVAPQKIWEAAAPATLLGYKKKRVLSTPDAPGGLFYQMAKSNDPVYAEWRRYAVTLNQARAQGFKVSQRAVRGIDLGNPQLHAQYFQCSFEARGNSLFIGVRHYTQQPKTLIKMIGVDFAYTHKTSSDWNVAVVLGYCQEDGMYYVLDVKRERTSNFTPHLRALVASHPGAQIHWYAMTSESGLGVNLRVEQGLPIFTHKIIADKYTRANPCAEAWNGDPMNGTPGRIVVPVAAPWLADFTGEVTTFHGGKTAYDQHDDQVDAMVSAFDALSEWVSVGSVQAKALPTKFNGGVLGLGVRNAPWMPT
jgi:predicted phage terminase large subunit-like protein